jgi:glutamate-1-semialdehyde 2,1-aminomutase
MGISETTSTALVAALEQAHAQYTKSHPQSLKIHEEACNYLPGGNTRTVLHTTPFPLTISSGQDTRLTTIDGRTYTDFLGEYTAGIYGHSHPVIKSALESALQNGWNYGGHNALEPQLAKIICDRFPSIDLVRFVNSGTEANMMALATAMAFTGRKKVLLFNKGYHGSTISGRAPSTKRSINLPHDFVLGAYNDVPGTEALIQSLPKDSLAAILIEPMLGSGGCYAGSAEFLGMLRRLASKHGALLIFDEVMTSRLHYNGLGSQTGVTPDLTTLGKWVGGGMSFGAFGGRRDIMGLYDPRNAQLEHPGTFNNNVFTMNAGVAGCGLLTAEKLDALNGLGVQLTNQVTDVLSKRGILDDATVPSAPATDEMHAAEHPQRPPKMFIKGVGSLMAVQFAGPDREVLGALFYHHMLEQGIYMAQRGFVALNIMLTKDHVALFVSAVEAFVQKWEQALKW